MGSKIKHVKKDSKKAESSNSTCTANYTTTLENVNTSIEKSTTGNKAKKKSEKKNLPAVRNIHAENLISPIDRFSGILFGCNKKVDIQETMRKLLSGNAEIKTDAKGKLTILASLSFDDLPEKLQVKLNDRFTRAVCDTITSLILAKNEYITPNNIAYCMNGYDNPDTTKEFLTQIMESVEILRHTWVKIDASNEAKARGYDFEELKFDGILAPIDKLRLVFMNGQEVEAYHVLREPILYKYAKAKNQVLTVDKDILKFPKIDKDEGENAKRVNLVNMTRENIILQRYLIERIEGMKNPNNNLGCIISYETLYEVLNAQEFSRTEKKRIRDRVKFFLDYWADLKYIKSYHEEYEGRLIKNIFIEPYENQENKNEKF